MEIKISALLLIELSEDIGSISELKGLSVSPQMRQDYLHKYRQCWATTGSLMGLPLTSYSTGERTLCIGGPFGDRKGLSCNT